MKTEILLDVLLHQTYITTLWLLCTRQTKAVWKPVFTAIRFETKLWNISLTKLLSNATFLLLSGSIALKTPAQMIGNHFQQQILSTSTSELGVAVAGHLMPSFYSQKKKISFKNNKVSALASSTATTHSLLPQPMVKYFDFIYVSGIINTAT